MRGRKPAPHTTERDLLVARASRAVAKAIEKGTLQHFSAFACADCGKQATCYDHRDYTKPLAVDPVCSGCNNRRGPGLPFPAQGDGSAHKHLLSAKAGKNWAGLDGGEGFAPLECRLAQGTEAEAEAAIARANTADSERLMAIREATTRNTFRLAGHKSGFSNLSGISRAEWFKRHDPWYA